MNDSSKRILCSDGNCVGTINERGVCNACGKPLKEWLKRGEQTRNSEKEKREEETEEKEQRKEEKKSKGHNEKESNNKSNHYGFHSNKATGGTNNSLFNPKEFLIDLFKYYMEFLETDFRENRSPSRKVTFHNKDGLLTDIDLVKYPKLSQHTTALLSSNFESNPLTNVGKEDFVVDYL